MARYAPGEVPFTADVHQVERYMQQEQEQVRSSTDDIYTLTKFSLEHFVAEAYLGLAVGTAYPLTISAAWTTINWDAASVDGGKAVFPALPTGMNFTDDAVWRMSVILNLTFNEENAGRTIKLRLYNTTTAAPNGAELWFSVGRNAPGFTATCSWLAEVPVDLLSQNLQLQISSADSFNNVQVTRASWAVNSVAKYQGKDPITSLDKQGKY